MNRIKKISKISSLAFSNGIRLHKDSILLFNNRSFPSAFQLSILAQEEIGKSFLLQEDIWQTSTSGMDTNDPDYRKILDDCFLNHKIKQGWFSKFADEDKIFKGKYTNFIKNIYEGKLDEKKQIATFVGLSKRFKKINWKSKIIFPKKRIKEKDVKTHITRVNDFVIYYIEGNRRGIITTDVEEIFDILTLEMSNELEKLWPFKSRSYEIIIKKYRKYSIMKKEELW